jgi:transformation/transcription domain-associated protein
MYTALADLVHHTRNDLAPHQILRGLNVFSKVIHNPSLGTNVHTLSLKMMFNLIDCVLAKQSPEEATKTICALFESCIEKLESLVIVLSEASAQIERKKTGGPEVIDCVYIERHRPVDNAMYATDKPEDILIGKQLPQSDSSALTIAII